MPLQATTTTPLFSAELTPPRSISPGGSRLVAVEAALFILTPALLVVAVDLALVLGLMLILAVAIALTLFASTRPGKRREQITVWADQLEWTGTDTKGDKVLRRFNPKTVRLVLDRDDDEKTLAVRLRNGKDELIVGSFLNGDDKSSFAKALGSALRKARAA